MPTDNSTDASTRHTSLTRHMHLRVKFQNVQPCTNYLVSYLHSKGPPGTAAKCRIPYLIVPGRATTYVQTTYLCASTYVACDNIQDSEYMDNLKTLKYTQTLGQRSILPGSSTHKLLLTRVSANAGCIAPFLHLGIAANHRKSRRTQVHNRCSTQLHRPLTKERDDLRFSPSSPWTDASEYVASGSEDRAGKGARRDTFTFRFLDFSHYKQLRRSELM
ncbi:hypothetical protein K435DRAFT_163572 [Dendrothele bispora CBS 962.96]|uniref:Uncharacterized protein n=1 Tax=Dendrothele bispora (strain CBS 962.96) TaxID=1314807 RepID=A0A4S8KLC7_DENBC|nr:hypothetical protein K435DRAFT_163572 [Dendrothele bispora CBS 962.96]